MGKLFKITYPSGKRSDEFYGKLRIGPKQWKRVKLFTDKTASERRFRELQSAEDQRAAGVINRVTDYALVPISQHVVDYLAWLKGKISSAEHHAIQANLLNRIVSAAGWKYIRDMTPESVESILDQFGKTVEYRNGIIKRAKAFAAWLKDRGRAASHPLDGLSRRSTKGAKRNRARRAANPEQVVALLSLNIPADRTLAYALAALNGFRRNEVAKLTWERVKIDAPIPFVDLAHKMTDAKDSIPLHPYVVKLLRDRTQAMPGVTILRAVPDVKTLKKDLTKIDVPFSDPEGRRLDFHGLRHTFQTMLDMAGVSRATKKRLMRHAGQDVTDGYAHAELAEMIVALSKLASPDDPPESQRQRVLGTGTTGATATTGAATAVDHRVDHGLVIQRQSAAMTGVGGLAFDRSVATVGFAASGESGTVSRELAASGLMDVSLANTMPDSRPDARVD